ncbi:unnamed protein product [Parnassius apollo]|uniref:(apollo) hypothetical protein n=1 Tax=Parnassius apollo TaxID=110799 RepID=A0A8S3W696_PARAO|nr:unnamed protein product [Parnassius apollo]
MFFDNEERNLAQRELFQVVSQELLALSSNFDASFGVRNIPTHTEDGIPIRKLYVSNLPPKTTRAELFGVFAQYGFIKSCWLRMGDKGPNRTPKPTYAFVTFINPADAHKALQAPYHEKQLRGRHLRISPADSWHQPAEDADGRVCWKPNSQRQEENIASLSGNDDEQHNDVPKPDPPSNTEKDRDDSNALADEQQQGSSETDSDFNILDVLNRDCLNHVLSYVPIRDLIRSERVSKRWQQLIQEFLLGVRIFKTSWWQHVPVILTTAVLRRVLQKVGGSITRLHIDHNWTALNDRTAHTVGKFCPNLEELKVVGMHTKNWNPLIYGCKQLKHLSFISCNKLKDSSLVQIVKSDSSIESLTVANNTHVTGLFLTGSNPRKLSYLAFYNCYSLQGAVLTAAIDLIPCLTVLKLDACPVTMWKIIPLILKKVPKLQELSLSEYNSLDIGPKLYDSEMFCESLSKLTELRALNLSKNIYVTNAVLKQVARSCPKLTALNISSCNSRRSYSHAGVGDEGLSAICRSCLDLSRLDVSYLAALSDNGLAAAARLTSLTSLTARGNAALSAQPFALCLASCHYLKEIDACGCDSVSEEVVTAAVEELGAHPRPLVLSIAATAAANVKELPAHKLLTVNTNEDRSNPHLRPDFVDHIFEDISDDSFEDLYDADDFDDFLGGDEDDFFDDDDDFEDYEGMYRMGLHAPDILLL